MPLRDRLPGLRSLRRPRLQYGLRSLLTATVILCLALGWHVDRVHRQRQAVAALKQAGARVEYSISRYNHYDMALERAHGTEAIEIDDPGTVAEWLEWLTPVRLRGTLGTDFFRHVDYVDLYEVNDLPLAVRHLPDLHGLRVLHLGVGLTLDGDLPPVGQVADLTHLDGSFSTITDAGLVYLAPLKSLEYLKLWNNSISGSGLEHLGQLQRLEDLDLRENPITDDGLAHLAKLRRITKLDLSYSEVTGSGFDHLAAMSDLQNLDLKSTKLTDEYMFHLASCGRLKDLSLRFTAVGDTGLQHLGGLSNLEYLDLSETLVTDDGLDSLRSLSRLEVLDLSSTAITDQGVRTLGALTSLKTLLIDNSAATAQGVAWLKRRLPRTDIDFGEQGDVASNQARVLMHAGLWRRALETLNKLDSSYLESPRGLRPLAKCHAGLGRWDDAERDYCRLLEIIPHSASNYWFDKERIWRELHAWPRLFERVALARLKDPWRWAASGHCAVLDGRWSDAVADFSRAAACPHTLDPNITVPERVEGSIEFQCGASHILAGNIAEARRVRDRLLEKEVSGGLLIAAHIQLLMPQGTGCPPAIEHWLRDSSHRGPFQILIYLRSGRFADVLSHELSTINHGRYWFSQAIAHSFLKHQSAARECFARGRRWLERHGKKARIKHGYSWACGLLQAEVLRRQAEQLIFH